MVGVGIREVRQAEAVQAFLSSSDRRSVINACPRFGKIRVAFRIVEQLSPWNVLLLAPRNDIFEGWKKEGMYDMDPVWDMLTFTSIKKIDRDDFGLVIIDEPHEMSVNQQLTLAEKLRKYKGPILGLTGTMTNKTKNELYDSLELDTCYTYSINQGVEEGILVDYQMFVHPVLLDNTVKTYGVKKNYTERSWFEITCNIAEDSRNPKTKHMMNLRKINIIQNSLAKKLKTQSLIGQFKDERVLVFCGVTEVADDLGISVYHSKVKEKQIFDDFCSGKGMHLATIKMMQAGVTVKPISKGIINYMSGNPEDSAQKICRFLGLEYDNLSKKAEIHIVSTTEPFELSRLKTGLAFFDPAKITYKT
jgi:superfamily II DNA or RNA helicase